MADPGLLSPDDTVNLPEDLQQIDDGVAHRRCMHKWESQAEKLLKNMGDWRAFKHLV